jgi:hypothetical protein
MREREVRAFLSGYMPDPTLSRRLTVFYPDTDNFTLAVADSRHIRTRTKKEAPGGFSPGALIAHGPAVSYSCSRRILAPRFPSLTSICS